MQFRELLCSYLLHKKILSCDMRGLCCCAVVCKKSLIFFSKDGRCLIFWMVFLISKYIIDYYNLLKKIFINTKKSKKNKKK
ncbi:hypothetical protein OIU78_002000 [Salix suchowensis]|nr:hypothetical protein OIU78_002000 [Salix suchowensis]